MYTFFVLYNYFNLIPKVTLQTTSISSRYLSTKSGREEFATNRTDIKKATMPPVHANGEFSAEKYVEDLIEANKVVIFAKTTCPWCAKVKELFKSLNEPFLSVELDSVG